MTFHTVAHVAVRDRDYNVYISINTETAQMHVFKYSESLCLCEYELCSNQTEVRLYLAKRLKGV